MTVTLSDRVTVIHGLDFEVSRLCVEPKSVLQTDFVAWAKTTPGPPPHAHLGLSAPLRRVGDINTDLYVCKIYFHNHLTCGWL